MPAAKVPACRGACCRGARDLGPTAGCRSQRLGTACRRPAGAGRGARRPRCQRLRHGAETSGRGPRCGPGEVNCAWARCWRLGEVPAPGRGARDLGTETSAQRPRHRDLGTETSAQRPRHRDLGTAGLPRCRAYRGARDLNDLVFTGGRSLSAATRGYAGFLASRLQPESGLGNGGIYDPTADLRSSGTRRSRLANGGSRPRR